MKDKKEFYNLLAELDGQPFPEYQKLIGDFDFTRYVIKCMNMDLTEEAGLRPVFSIRVPQTISEIPEYLFDSPVRRTAMEDLLLRRMADRIASIAHYDQNGLARRHIHVATPNQKILPRNALLLTREYIEVRIEITLPVRTMVVDGEPTVSIDGAMAQQIFYEDLPEVVSNSLLYCNIDIAEADAHVNCMEDADRLRQYLGASGQVAFVSEGALVSRETDADTPDFSRLDPVEIGDELAEEVEVPHSGVVRGLGIPNGLTLILGESNSGRVDLMDAIAQGIYNHIPGDGREHVVTVADAVNIRSEVGRSIQQVDISAFANRLSDGGLPSSYSTKGAGAFTSQAASTVEALEAGARVLLYDEHSSSSTFLSSDTRVASLMNESSRNTLAARARQMVDELGISMVVAGSSLVAEFIPIADKILKVENFTVTDITEEAKTLDITPAAPVNDTVNLSSMLSRSRWVMPSSIDPSIGREDLVIETDDVDFLQFGRSLIDLDAVRQIADADQARAIGYVLYYAKLRYMDEGYPLREILDLVDRDLSNEGLNALARDVRGDLARPRRYEVAAMLNRLPAFRVSHVTE
ncbi:P-loop domain-containing protein [Pontiella agarivorans]|uniref:ABC-ATPase domain-containing protein n=1 Tax=Pontiella agarivorans TaxID=3038953 RepID=A0ABU5MXU7_9BACT|nr:P-loop domain-containing protein [Pontiella agarivorans]MDZ8118995.1 ABC-ATPase domain-containing protein [Pontiella agarivorans]